MGQHVKKLEWLTGGGLMGELIVAKDWSQSLRTLSPIRDEAGRVASPFHPVTKITKVSTRLGLDDLYSAVCGNALAYEEERRVLGTWPYLRERNRFEHMERDISLESSDENRGTTFRVRLPLDARNAKA